LLAEQASTSGGEGDDDNLPSPSPVVASVEAQRISVTDDYLDIEICSKFFVESFWEKGMIS
jgi:hypothetical protein